MNHCVSRACAFLAVFTMTLFFFAPSPAHADCTGPAGVEGEMTYDSAHDVMVFCDGDDWYVAGGGGGGLPSCSTTGDKLTWNGSNWICSSNYVPPDLNDPVWTTAAGTVAAVAPGAALSGVNVVATDDSGSVTYSKQSGDAWISVNSSTGELTGTAPVTEDTYSVIVRAEDAAGNYTDRTFSINVAHVKVTYTYTGSDQSFVVPAGVTSVSFKVWGAGGGQKNSGYGGAGGFVSGSVPVTAGQTVTLIVGQGGSNVSTGTYNYGGGGWISTDDAAGGSGGGRSAVRINGVEVLTAGGGGGGGYGSGHVGGVGGGSVGGNATGTGAGFGATSSAGGAGGNSSGGTAEAGIQYRGGRSTTSYAGGGGGGGWYGGGGGSGTGYNHGGGGGGSGYVAGSVTGGVNTAGTGSTPPNQGDSDYVSGVGVGATSGTTGGNGLIVVSY